MNEEAKQIFLNAVRSQVEYVFNHFHEVAQKLGFEAAGEDLSKAMETSGMIAQLDEAGIRHSTFAEDMVGAAWEFACIMLDLDRMGVKVITDENGNRILAAQDDPGK